MLFCNYTEQEFLKLRDSTLDMLLRVGGFYKSFRNDKYFLYKKPEKSFRMILEALNAEDLNLYRKYMHLFSTEKEAFYCLRHNDTPFKHICPICGNFAAFQCDSNEYTKTCSNKKCYQKVIHSSEAVEKMKATNLHKYGYENVGQVDSVKEKMKATCLERYGTEYALSNKGVISKRYETNLRKYGSTQPMSYNSDRFKELMVLKYGVDNAFKSDEIKEKIKKANLERYGYESAIQNTDIKNKSVQSKINRIDQLQNKLGAVQVSRVVLEFGNGWYLKRHELGINLIRYGTYKFVSNADIEKIKEYNRDSINNGTSHKEIEVQNYVKTLVPDIEVNNRSVIKPRELDIYVPSKNVAIEYNGLFWHSSLYRGKLYHLEKTKACQALGIRLIQFYSDEWDNKKDICKSLISSALGVYDRKIYARCCDVRDIDSVTYSKFLDENHIQGSISSKKMLGLFYKDELVQVAGWGTSRFKKGEIELHRMASKKFVQVVGGFSKLIRHSGIDKFISYVDLRLFDASGYIATGFKKIGESKPSYFYLDKTGKTRMNRLRFQKHKLPSILDNFDATLTEEENMFNNGFYRIYDCGELKLEYDAKK